MRQKIIIPRQELARLYYKENKSKYKIGDIYGCSFSTVLNRMREYGFKPLSRSLIQSKYIKHDFKGRRQDKAYMLGFRLGDLNVYKTTQHSEVVVVRCHTTCQDQVDIMRELFGRYGKVSVNKSAINGSFSVNCFLNNSFAFLLPKTDSVASWIGRESKSSAAFAAGYIDAEGNIGVYDGRARLKIDSYDKNIIFWLYQWFGKHKISCPAPIMIGRKNQIYDSTRGYKYHKDLWRVRVSERESLGRLFNILRLYLKHKKRKLDLDKCLINLNVRRNKEN